VSGRVVDAVTGAPIADARIVARSDLTPNEATGVNTDANGFFLMERRSRLELLPIATDLMSPDATLTVEAAGFRLAQLKIGSLLSPPSENMTIKLVRNEKAR
jgi:hypothetical protein